MKLFRFAFLSLLTICLPVGNAWSQATATKIPTTEPINRDGSRHQVINGRAEALAGMVDLLFLGDSITQGWEGRGPSEIWDKYFLPRRPLNAGISGDKVQHVLWRLDNGNILGIKPKLVVLMIGTNNSGVNTSEEIAAGITAIVDKLRQKLPASKVLVLGIFPRGADKNDKYRKVNEGANAVISKLDDGKHVFYLDIGPKFMAEDGTISREIMKDLVHLTDKGYQIWAESIDAKVSELLGEKK